MAVEIKKEIALEIAHVLFLDVVGYSKLLVDEQRAVIDELNSVVRETDEYREAKSAGRLIKIPTGDGMALVFYSSPEAPLVNSAAQLHGWNQPAAVNVNIANIPMPTAEERAEMRALDDKLDAIAAKLKG